MIDLQTPFGTQFWLASEVDKDCITDRVYQSVEYTFVGKEIVSSFGELPTRDADGNRVSTQFWLKNNRNSFISYNETANWFLSEKECESFCTNNFNWN